jgi:benzoyl-CoA reductase/2-hydroxyglutaryl-CoA dehydratase subunit BcrC/BadD/HgdB
MARITGTTPDEPALRQAIAAGNQRRGLLTQLVERRRAIIPLVSGADARAVFAASQVMTTEAFDAALERDLAAAAPVVVGPRIVLAGSGQHTGALHEMIEGELAVVVGDFHEFGEPMIGGPIDETAPPLRAITAHYHRTVASSRSFPQSSEPLAQFARDAGAEGVIFYFFQEEEALTWEYPAQREALHAAGIATLCFEGMPPRPQAAEIGRAVAGFIDGLRQGVRP